jgi:hypothetical protein
MANTAPVARNFTWDPTAARPPPDPASGQRDMGQWQMASNGSVVLLFGSNILPGVGYYSYTELYNETNNTWWQVSGTMPPSLANFSMASDSGFDGGVAVLFGGQNTTSGAPSNATWIFSFAHWDWNQLSMKVAPPARDDAAMAADPTTNMVLLAAGWNNTTATVNNDLWELNLSSSVWTSLGSAPQMVAGHTGEFGSSMLWNGPNHFILFGGCTIAIPSFKCSNTTASIYLGGGGPKMFYNQTNGPSHRAFASWEWDPAQNVSILFGGANLQLASTLPLNDTWEYLPSQNLWIEQSLSVAPYPVGTPQVPSPRYLAPAAWVNVASNETLLMTGGVGLANPGEPIMWRLAPTMSIQLTVKNLSGQLVPFVIATATTASYVWSSCTDSYGATSFFQVAPGATEIFISGSASCFSPLSSHGTHLVYRYYPYYENITTIPGVDRQITITLTPLPNLDVRSWFTVGSSPMKVLPYVSLFWNSTKPSIATTNSTGWAIFDLSHGGSVSMLGNRSGYANALNSTVVATTGTTYLNLTLARLQPSNVSVRVVDAGGRNIVGATVSVRNGTEGISQVTTTNPYGYANVTAILPSGVNVTVTITSTGYYQNTTSRLLVPGRTVFQNTTLVRLPRLVVRTWALNLTTQLIGPLGDVDLYWNTTSGGNHVNITGAGGWANITLPSSTTAFFNSTKIGYAEMVSGSAVVVPYTGTAYLNLTLRPVFLNLTAYVKDKSGVGLVGVLVNYTIAGGSGPWGQATTTVGGVVAFTNVLPGSARIVAFAITGYYGNITSVTIPAGKWHTFVNITLTSRPSLHIRVMGDSPLATHPVPLYLAFVSRNLTYNLTETSFYGWINQTVSAPGRANISANHTLYYPGHENVVVNHTGILNVTLFLQPIVGTIDIDAIAPVSAGAGQPVTDYPLPGVTVNVTSVGVSGTTSLAGWDNITLFKGTYNVSAWAWGYKPVNDLGPLKLGNLTRTLDFYPLPGANMSVLVHDANTSLPISNASVDLEGFELDKSTNSAGWAYFIDILRANTYPYPPGPWPPGPFVVEASAAGYLSNTAYVSLNYFADLPQVLINLTPLYTHRTVNSTTSSQFSLVPAGEHDLWWPFLLIPVFFAIGCVLVILAQRSSSSRQRSGKT